MNNMESIIKKAIEGGYKLWSTREIEFSGANDGIMVKNGPATRNGESVWTFKDTGSSFMHSHTDTVLDPLFWQALGEACQKDWLDWAQINTGDKPGTIKMYYIYALRFMEINLTEGWDKAVEYLKEVTK